MRNTPLSHATLSRPARPGGLRDRSGMVAMEFAILALPLFILVLGTMEVGYDFFVQASLDNAVQVAARSVQVGSAQRGANQTLANFVQNAMCPALGKLLNCNQLYVSVTAVPNTVGQNYYTYITANPITVSQITSGNNTICTGVAGQLMMVRAYYLSPTYIGMLIPSFSVASPFNANVRVHAAFAAAGFVNENFTGGQQGC